MNNTITIIKCLILIIGAFVIYFVITTVGQIVRYQAKTYFEWRQTHMKEVYELDRKIRFIKFMFNILIDLYILFVMVITSFTLLGWWYGLH